MTKTAELGFEAARTRGADAQRGWVRDEVVLPAAVFAKRRSVRERDLVQLTAKGALFSVAVDGAEHYPAALLELSQNDVVALCQALSWSDSSGKLIFLMRRHGALGGQTVSEAISAGRLFEVLQLARAWREG
ncbi:MAG: hypothetical protein H6933_10980 [Burkholderiaceae bacterium]|nr:hypothetical protein [Burkholderiaceae bacterium]